MQKSERMTITEAVKTGVSIAIVRHQVNKLKDRQDEAEKIVPAYKSMAKKKLMEDNGHLVDFPMFKKRCTEAEDAVKNSNGLRAWLSALEREKTFRTMTLELLEEARSHVAMNAIKGMMEIAEDTAKLFEDIRKTNESKETKG